MQVGPAPQSSATPTPPEGTARPGAGHAGLSDAEAAARLRRDGPNLLPEAEGRHWARLLADVLREPMLLLLVAAASVYLLLGDPFEAVALFASVLLVAGLSFYQQQRAEGALRALRELSSPRAQVLREGGWRRVPASELVLGDTIDLREGDRVPADARLERGPGVTLDESLLTGESAPVRRAGSDPDPEVRRVLASTLVVGGQSEACVTATGTRTEVGRIGQALRTARWHPTPTQREMRRAIVVFSFVGIASCVLVVWLYAAAHGDWLRALLAGITLAISNIPEEFPLVMTVFLALGAWRLAQARTLVRRPPAIETLGSITVLCTDKTGTLTANRMRVVELVADGRRVPASDALEGTAREVLRQADLACPALTHDPMERAIRALAATRGEAAAATAPVRVYPLSNELLAYAQVWALPDGGLHVACKGAPEAIAALCGRAGAEADAVLGEATCSSQNARKLSVWPRSAACRAHDRVRPLPW